ncbi:MAG: hypothetical protein BMS9Abin29_1447 [Gemmatimonadota bacterium]|nr:MAG: hypothetical protein BMS9Abin29_1447 [Gemmatimonadota bacterium]
MESTASQDRESKRSAMLMVVAFLSMGAFLVWLGVAAQTSEVAIVEVSATDSLAASAVTVQAAVLGADPMAQAGQLIRVEDLNVAGAIGSTAFWTTLEGRPDPFLVHMDSAVVADSIAVGPGDRVTVVGNIYEMSDSVADEWEATGSISENQKFEVTFATSFLEIMDLTVIRPGAGGE